MVSKVPIVTAIRTRRVRGSGPVAHGAGRVCAYRGCSTRLSRYNAKDVCAVHRPINYPRMRA